MQFLGGVVLVIVLVVIGLTLLGVVKPVTDRTDNGNVRIMIGVEIQPTPTLNPTGAK